LHGWGEPASDGSSTYVLTRGHELIALHTATGVLRWRAPTGGPGDAPWGSAVRIAGPRVIVGDDAIVAFDRATGREAWRFVPPAGVGSGPFLGDTTSELAAIGSPNGHVYAVDTSSGRVRWMHRVATAGPTTVHAPVWVRHEVVASFTTFGTPLSGGVVAFDAQGRRLWRRLLAGVGAAGPPVAVDGVVVVALTDGRIQAFQARTGLRLWTLPRMRSRDPHQPLVRDVRALSASQSVLIASSLTGALVAYDVPSRRERWRYVGGPDGAAALRIRADATTVYAPFTDGSLVALSLATGRERWRAGGAGAAIAWPPSTVADAVVTSGDDAIVAFAVDRPGHAADAEDTHDPKGAP
jgi:outer membrane protein assembly factor BamB